MNEIVLREYTKDEIQKLRDSYPDYIPMSIIMDREKQKIHSAESERLQNGIRKLSKEITILHRELTIIREVTGPAICKKCTTLNMAWKKLSCGHILCTTCIQLMVKKRHEEIIKETHERMAVENGGRSLISWRTKYEKVDESDPRQICPFCRPKK